MITLNLILGSAVNAQPCLPEGIIFNYQSQIDSFPIYYPNCSQILGDVKIVGEDITSLDSLIYLNYINGNLQIGGSWFIPNPILSDISGVSNLDSVGGNLKIINNPGLEDLNAFLNLKKINGSLTIDYNVLLEDIDGLQNLDHSTLGNLNISNNPMLSECDVFFLCDYLDSPPGKVTIFDNDSGCDSPTEIAENCGVQLDCLPYGDYNFTSQHQLDSFIDDYGICDTIYGSVYIRGEDIHNLSSLQNTKAIFGKLVVSGNPELIDLGGLENLEMVLLSTAIGGWYFPFYEENNDQLVDLSALSSLKKAGIIVSVGNNGSLSDLTGLENIVLDSNAQLMIFNNPGLSECNIRSICDHIAAQGDADFINNKVGCNNKTEVEESCISSTTESEIVEIFNAYPNPFTTSTTIEYELQQPTTVQITIYNHLGKQVEFIQQKQTQGMQQVVWNAENKPAGIYNFRLQAGMQVASGKMVLMR